MVIAISTLYAPHVTEKFDIMITTPDIQINMCLHAYGHLSVIYAMYYM